MEIKKIFSEPCDNNTYVVSDNKKAILIDASCDIEEVEKFLDGKKLVAIFVTHAHYDHVANLDNLVKKYNVKVYLTMEAFKKLNNPMENCSYVFGVNYNRAVEEGVTMLGSTIIVVNEFGGLIDLMQYHLKNYPN
jgi:glyoxylase-like metal-dependent hydrolase (beta-lactamase superfamily II)